MPLWRGGCLLLAKAKGTTCYATLEGWGGCLFLARAKGWRVGGCLFLALGGGVCFEKSLDLTRKGRQGAMWETQSGGVRDSPRA